MKLLNLAALGLAMSLVGCGAIDDYRLNSAVDSYRMECFGSGTNDCGDMLVDTNILMLEHFRESVDDNEDEFMALFGEDGLEAFNTMIDKLIEKQEGMRPGFFTLGGGQYKYAGRNFLLNAGDFADMKAAITAHFGKDQPETVAEDASDS